jgi:hypothetical protein
MGGFHDRMPLIDAFRPRVEFRPRGLGMPVWGPRAAIYRNGTEFRMDAKRCAVWAPDP